MKYFISYIWAIIWGGLILVLLLMPPSNFSDIPVFPGIDKMVHCGIFFVQATLLYWENIAKSKRTANKWLTTLKVLVITSIYAALTELAQMYLTNTRTADLWDIFADIVGVGMATFAFLLIYKPIKS